MAARLPLTNEIKNFLIANYGTVRQIDIAKHLGVSVATVKVWGTQLHLTSPKTTKKEKLIFPQEPLELKGYCQDCALYRPGGSCSKTGRYTGALNKKKCFTETID